MSMAKSVDLALALDLMHPRDKLTLFFERALELCAPDIKEERKRLQEELGGIEGFNAWAEKYGLPLHSRPSGHGEWAIVGPTNWPEPETPKEHTFTYRARSLDESPKDYSKAIREAFKRWEKEVQEEEKHLWKKKPYVNLKVRYHAEWYVLHYFKNMSYSEIAAWETQQSRGDENITDEGTVAKGIKRFAENTFMPRRQGRTNKGGRPRKTLDIK